MGVAHPTPTETVARGAGWTERGWGQPVAADAAVVAAVHLTSCPDWLQLPLVAAAVVVDYVVDNRRYAFYVYYVNIYIMQQVNLHTLTHTYAHTIMHMHTRPRPFAARACRTRRSIMRRRRSSRNS